MGPSSPRKIWPPVTMTTVQVVLCSLLSLTSAQLFGTPRARPRGVNQGDVVQDVITQLQPTIIAAVQAALGGSSLTGSSLQNSPTGSIRPVNSKYPPAQYQYEYKVANDRTQTYINQQEARDGLEVDGSYSYVDPTGAIVTVNYKAGVDGYSETRERQEGAVDIRPASPSSGSSGGQVDVDQLVAAVLAALQPQIQAAVNEVVF